MLNEFVNEWKQTGKLYLWKYTENSKNYPGWHLHADLEGCTSLIKLICLMRMDKFPAKRTVKISAPNSQILSVPNNKRGKAKWKTLKKLKIKSVKSASDYKEQFLTHKHNHILLTADEIMLTKLEQGFNDITKGKGEYSICHDGAMEKSVSSCLWFWW